MNSKDNIVHISHLSFLLKDVERYKDIFIRKSYNTTHGLPFGKQMNMRLTELVRFHLSGAEEIEVTSQDLDKHFLEYGSPQEILGFIDSYTKQVGLGTLGKLEDVAIADCFRKLFINYNSAIKQDVLDKVKNTNRAYKNAKKAYYLDKGLPFMLKDIKRGIDDAKFLYHIKNKLNIAMLGKYRIIEQHLDGHALLLPLYAGEYHINIDGNTPDSKEGRQILIPIVEDKMLHQRQDNGDYDAYFLKTVKENALDVELVHAFLNDETIRIGHIMMICRIPPYSLRIVSIGREQLLKNKEAIAGQQFAINRFKEINDGKN